MVVPHVVRPWNSSDLSEGMKLRLKLGITSSSATVFGRYGGKDQFNIDYVSKTVRWG